MCKSMLFVSCFWMCGFPIKFLSYHLLHWGPRSPTGVVGWCQVIQSDGLALASIESPPLPGAPRVPKIPQIWRGRGGWLGLRMKETKKINKFMNKGGVFKGFGWGGGVPQISSQETHRHSLVSQEPKKLFHKLPFQGTSFLPRVLDELLVSWILRLPPGIPSHCF